MRIFEPYSTPDAPQIVLKKQHGSLKAPTSYIIRACAVTTSLEARKLLWFNEIKDLDKATLSRGLHMASMHSRPELSTPSSAIEYVRNKLSLGLVPREHIGRNGKPGLAYPPLQEYDSIHTEVIGVSTHSPHSPISAVRGSWRLGSALFMTDGLTTD